MEILDANVYGKLTPSRLDDFETNISSKLPAEYRDFLVKYNGGKPARAFFKTMDNISRIHGQFYGLHEGPTHFQLDMNNQILKGRLPLSALAIANDPFGNRICIALSREQFGQIFFWEHDRENHPENYPISLAPSFTAFADSLMDWHSPNQSEITRVVKDGDLQSLKSFLEEGYDVEKEHAEGRTILELAAIQNQPDMVELLLKKGAKLRNALSLAERNAKYFPEHKKIVEIIKSFLAKGDQSP